jgi:thioredoxin reductase (NADPH)
LQDKSQYWGDTNKGQLYEDMKRRLAMYDIGVVGGGIAGMTAAIYGLRAGKTVVLLEGTGVGGQITMSSHVENYPGIVGISGNELAAALKQQIDQLGAEVRFAQVQGIACEGEVKKLITASEEIECKKIILATGLSHRKLGVPGEDKLIGSGVSYCAVCDGTFFKGMDVAVVGGGSTALQDAAYLSTYCNKVYLIHRRDAFRGEKHLVEELQKKENVTFVLDSVVTEILGSFMVEGVKLMNKKTEEVSTLPVDGVFVAVGQIPGNDMFADVVELDEDGYIRASEDCRTSAEGIYAAGDCRTKTVRQLTTAAADGAVAALAASGE